MLDSVQMTRLLALFPFALLCSLAALAQGTHLWNQSSTAEFERGTPDGVSISSEGRLASAPTAHALLTTGSTFVWSVAADTAGNAYLATGAPAEVLRVTSAGVQTRLFSTKDLTVQVVRLGPDGALYVATLPSGRVYRLDPSQVDQPEAKATVVFDPAQTAEKSKYVWDLAFDSQGRIYVATGAPGGIYRVALPKGGIPAKPELFYASDEPHIRALLFSSSGTLYAGSDGSGLVYRISPDGKAFILFEAAKREITALALGRRGQLYVAAVGERGHSPLPPLSVTGAVTATITIVPPGSVQAFNGNASIPDGSEIYEIPGEAASGSTAGVETAAAPGAYRLWSSHDEILYALRSTDQGLLAASGNHGRLYQIAEDGSATDLAHLEASQITGLADGAAGLYASTANTGKLYLLSHTVAPRGSFESEVFDARVRSLWGRVEALGTGDYQLYARVGNVESPLRGWTNWRRVDTAQSPGAAQADAGGHLLFPSARYAQWKAILSPGATISTVGINYLPINIPPVIDDILVVPGARANAQPAQPQGPQQVFLSFPGQASNSGFDSNSPASPLAAFRDKGAVTARWAAHDDNGDELVFALYYRSEGRSENRGESDAGWRLLKDKLTERFYSFDASLLPDGAYRMRVVASDAPSHPAGEALTADRESASFLIATATPQVLGLAVKVQAGNLHVTATATDAATPIARAEYSIDAGPWQYVYPVGGISDSLVEHYDFSAPLASPASAAGSHHTVTLRVFDRYDNAAAAEALAR